MKSNEAMNLELKAEPDSSGRRKESPNIRIRIIHHYSKGTGWRPKRIVHHNSKGTERWRQKG